MSQIPQNPLPVSITLPTYQAPTEPNPAGTWGTPDDYDEEADWDEPAEQLARVTIHAIADIKPGPNAEWLRNLNVPETGR